MIASATTPNRPALQELLDSVETGCTDCGICVTDCAFLRRYGTPKTIADSFAASDRASLSRPFECSLCGLCTAVCQERLDLENLFLEMRREAVERGFGHFPEHAPLLNYEHLGISRRFTLYRLPAGCSSIFFPGCALSGTRPEGVSTVFSLLQKANPALGIVFDCCLKPSHSLGRERYATAMFAEMRNYLLEQGVKEVLVGCPNCQIMFESFGQGLAVRTVYEVLEESALPLKKATGSVTVHDPCVIRNAEPVQQAVRTLLQRQGLTVEEMPHSGKTTLCCGLGGGVKLLAPDLAKEVAARRKNEAQGRRIITYCAGCVEALAPHTPTSHLLDLLFAPEQTLAGKVKGTAAPFTFLNRLRLKKRFKTMEGSAMLRERTFTAEEGQKKNRSWKPLIFLVLLPACVAFIVFSSSLLGLLRGKLSPTALLGIALMVAVTLLPVFYRRYKSRIHEKAVTE
ncbi:MAG: (Fe-S)-binding protein [Geobacter sp.]|nr:MAG: (Fe-S)-binding protein [Geobacter sp.]